METRNTQDRLQKYEFENYTLTTNFATYDDALNYANETKGELIEVGFTDGSDNPLPNNSANLIEDKKTFKVELPFHTNYEVLYSEQKVFRKWLKNYFLT